MAKNRTVQLKSDGTKITFGRRLTKAEKKAVKRQVTRAKLAQRGALK